MSLSPLLDRSATLRAAARALAVSPEALDLDAFLTDRPALSSAARRLHADLARTPDDADLACGLAHLMLAGGRPDLADDLGGRALRLEPGRSEPYAVLATAAALRGGWSIAAGYGLMASCLDPGSEHVARLLEHTQKPLDPYTRRRFPWLGGVGDAAGGAPEFVVSCRPPGGTGNDLLVMRELAENVLFSAFKNGSGRNGLVVDIALLSRFLDPNHVNLVVLDLIQRIAPDTLYLQAGGISRRHELPAEFLLALRQEIACPFVMLYSDAAKPFYYDIHRRIYAPAIDASIAIDAGFPDALSSQTLINAWTPVDSADFHPGTGERPVDVLFSGQQSRHYALRGAMIRDLRDSGIDIRTPQDEGRRLSRREYADRLRSARIAVNFCKAPMLPVLSKRDTEAEIIHLKGRVLEALASGCLLLEEENEITSRFFVANRHYVPWSGIEDLKEKIQHYLAHDAERAAIAAAGHAEWMARYTEQRFWAMVQAAADSTERRAAALAGQPRG